MRKFIAILFIVIACIASVSFSKESLREIYSRPASQWPAPFIDAGVHWNELDILPPSPLATKLDSLKDMIQLGKFLFFDTRLSSSGKIACATCHQPELSWTDGKERSFGHDSARTKRNSPTIQNSWFYEKLFWDGRAKNLQDQAFAPINSETEMHSDMPGVMNRIRKSKNYPLLFKKAFGDDDIDPDRMTEAIAVFEKTIVSRKSRFDEFLEGNKNALSNNEIRGLHLFRTKARCINCHNGPLFSDNGFHNSGFSGTDEGLYKVTHKEEDKGKFKTPSLRDVMYTGPWMHDGSERSMAIIIGMYSKGPIADNERLIKPLGLNARETKDLLSFLKAISAPPLEFIKPVIPE